MLSTTRLKRVFRVTAPAWQTPVQSSRFHERKSPNCCQSDADIRQDAVAARKGVIGTSRTHLSARPSSPPRRRFPLHGAQAQRLGNSSWIGWLRNRASGNKNRSPSRSNTDGLYGSSRGNIPSFIYLPAMDAPGWCLFSATERLRRRDREIFLQAWPKRWRTLLDTAKERECSSS